MSPDDWEDPTAWSDDDYDLSETPPEEWPLWAVQKYIDPQTPCRTCGALLGALVPRTLPCRGTHDGIRRAARDAVPAR